MPEESILQLGAVTILFAIFIRCFFVFLNTYFDFLKTKKNNKEQEIFNPNVFYSELKLINQKLDNHIVHFCKDLEECKLDIKELKEDNQQIKIELVKISALCKTNLDTRS